MKNPTYAPSIGDSVISFHMDDVEIYGGDDGSGVVTHVARLRSGAALTVRCPIDHVAPADIAVPAKDDRAIVTKVTTKPYSAHGQWSLSLPGRPGLTFHRSKRDATAAGARGMAILDHVATRTNHDANAT